MTNGFDSGGIRMGINAGKCESNRASRTELQRFHPPVTYLTPMESVHRVAAIPVRGRMRSDTEMIKTRALDSLIIIMRNAVENSDIGSPFKMQDLSASSIASHAVWRRKRCFVSTYSASRGEIPKNCGSN